MVSNLFFSSLPNNDPLRSSILTIAPESWTVRETAREFGTNRQIIEKARLLKAEEGMLALPHAKAGLT